MDMAFLGLRTSCEQSGQTQKDIRGFHSLDENPALEVDQCDVIDPYTLSKKDFTFEL